jgi:GMP synthase-like glutamine amidotransferase
MQSGRSGVPTALLLQHDRDAPAGLLAEWAAARGWTFETVRMHLGERAPDSLDGYDRVVSLGSLYSADDESVAWQEEERRALARAIEADVPVLGICFGGQSLAMALGGGVRRAERPEIGCWSPVETADATVVGAGPWFEWHVDAIEPPEGAEVLAHNESGVQAWRLGRHVGLQFHPEVDESIVAAWARGSDDPRVPGDVLERTAEVLPEVRERAFALFDALLAAPAPTRGG